MHKPEHPENLLKKDIALLSKEIIAGEKKATDLIRKEMKLEKKLTVLLAKMIVLEETKVSFAKQTTAEKEARLRQRIGNLQKKQLEYEKKKEAAKHIKEKQEAIKKEIDLINSRLKSDTAELYGIKKMAGTATLQKEKKPLGSAVKKISKAKEKKAKKIVLKPAGSKKEAKKQLAKNKKIAEVTEELRKALEKEKEEAEEQKEEAIEGQPEKQEIPEPEEPEPEEKKEDSEESGGKEVLDWEKRQRELAGEPPEEPEKTEGNLEEKFEEGEDALEEENKKEGLEEIDLAEESVEESSQPEETEEQEQSEEGPVISPEKNTKQYKDGDISLVYPDWPESREKSPDSLLAVAQGQFRFELSKTEAFNQAIQKFVSSKIAKIQSKKGSKILLRKETSNNIFLEYSEENSGQKSITKALFIMHKNNVYSIAFTSPSNEFQKIDDIFLKTIFSVQTH
ncbi:MAG: hypothetical protein PHD95_05350 [Candidatus ainarchaeum sp.]|nr:hypothetical protein [Candidatus ainarchaeum sp.]